jgi:predicted HicB family RNase H-like nuclease
MAYTKASNKAVQKYDQIKVLVKKGEREEIKNYAESQGMSLNGYINKLIKDDMKTADKE